MKHAIQLFLVAEAAAFAGAAIVHGGAVADGYVHREARIAETVIAGVLVAGLLATVVRPRLVRAVGLAVQGVALLGTLVGIAMIIAGAGPQSALDLVYHLTIAAVLVIGLCSVSRVCTPES